MNYFLSIIKYLGIGERTANTIIKKRLILVWNLWIKKQIVYFLKEEL